MPERIVVYSWTVIHSDTVVKQDARLYGTYQEAKAKADMQSVSDRDQIKIFESVVEVDPILAYRMLQGFAENGYGFCSVHRVVSSKELILGTSKSS